MSIYNEYLTIILAWQMARVYGLNQAAAIRRCARKIRRKTKNQSMYALCTNAVKQTDDALVIKKIEEVFNKMSEG